MSIQKTSLKKQLRKGFNHSSKQKGWSENSYRPSKTLEESKYLSDEEYSDRLGVHNPLWRYIIKRYTTESEAPLLVIGMEALPLAIELSQWTYPINFIVRNEQEKAKAESDSKRHAGNFKTFINGFKKSRVAIFIGIIDDMSDRDARRHVDYLSKGVNEVVCAVRPDRDWERVFGKRLVDSLKYYKGQYRLLRIS